MKTNSQRAAEVLEKVDKPQVATKPKFSFNKRFVAILTTCVVCFAVFATALGFALNHFLNSKMLSLDKMYITNYSQDIALGAGQKNVGGSQPSNVAFAQDVAYASGGEENYLVCVDKNGGVERAKFASRPNASGKDIPLSIRTIMSLKKYTIVEFTTETNANTNLPYFGDNNNDRATYIIDNQTGKFYALSVLNGSNPMHALMQIRTNADFCESDSSIYFWANSYTKGISSIYQAYVENDKLVLKEVFDFSKNLVKCEGSFIVDRYDNVFITSDTRSQYKYDGRVNCYYNYRINKDGDLLKLDNLYIKRSQNGEVYVGNKKFDENGDLVETSFYDTTLFYSETYIKTQGDSQYFYEDNSIKKITWQNDIEFTCETIELEKTTEMYVATKDYIYFCGDEKIFRASISTGEIEDLPLDKTYFFTSISTDNLGNVLFNALDEHQNNIAGKINNAGEIDVNLTPSEYKVYYVSPLW